VEKILFIHSSAGVYYHHYPFFLSKLTKEGKVSKRGQALRGKANTTRTRLGLQKKKKHTPVASTTATMTPTLVDLDCRHFFKFKRRHCSTSAWSTGRTRCGWRIRNEERTLHALKT
jgi:hypothetical protein